MVEVKRRGLRILQVVRQFLPRTGGMQEYVAQLSRHLINLGHEVDVLTLNRIIHSFSTLSISEITGTLKVECFS